MKNKYDYSKIRARTAELGTTDKAVAAAAKMTPSTYSLKMQGKSEFTQEQIRDICDYLRVSYADIPQYFFTLEVQNN